MAESHLHKMMASYLAEVSILITIGKGNDRNTQGACADLNTSSYLHDFTWVHTSSPRLYSSVVHAISSFFLSLQPLLFFSHATRTVPC